MIAKYALISPDGRLLKTDNPFLEAETDAVRNGFIYGDAFMKWMEKGKRVDLILESYDQEEKVRYRCYPTEADGPEILNTVLVMEYSQIYLLKELVNDAIEELWCHGFSKLELRKVLEILESW